MSINTSIDSKGYTIEKKSLKPKQLDKLKKDLTVSPKILDVGGEVPSFEVFTEDTKNIYIPRFYGIKKYGEPKINKLEETKIDIQFTGKLRDYQENIVKLCNEQLKSKGGGLLCVGCGQGKCLAKGTLIIMYDGTIKPVETIKVNDLLMGDDNTPRKVLSLANGKEELFDIIDYNNNYKYTVNKSHILSLKWMGENKFNYGNIKYSLGDTVDIPLDLYITLPNEIKDKLKGYRVPLDFNNTNNTKEDYYKVGYYYSDKNDLSSYKYLSKLDKIYLVSGIIDKYGEIIINSKNNTGVIIEKDKIDLENFIFLVRSIGISILNDEKYIELLGSGLYQLQYSYLLKLYSEDSFKKDALIYDIEVNSVGEGEYYGFTIDNNRRFVLGDFTVTHNTVMGLKIIADLQVKTLVLVHKTFLQDQWLERCSQFTNAKVGLIRQNKVEIENKDICIGMVQSITSRDYDLKLFESFSLIIFDEAHRYPSKVFSQAFQKTCPKYIFSLSATPDRVDGLTKVLNWYSGDIIYKQLSKPNKQVVVKIFNYDSNDPLFKEETMWVKGDYLPSNTKMINNLVNIKSRNNHILTILNHLRKYNERKVLVLSGRREHLTELKDNLDACIKDDIDKEIIMKDECKTYYYVGGMNKDALQEAAQKGDILFGTYDMAQEGLDIDKLNTLILATPKKNVTQALGRIMRKILKEGDVRPLIIDMADELSIYTRQAGIRLKEYTKNKYMVENYYLKNDKIETYESIMISKMGLSKEEAKEFMDTPENYEPDITKILDLQKVEELD
jgi:superfamily II DNA or RNA helicase